MKALWLGLALLALAVPAALAQTEVALAPQTMLEWDLNEEDTIFTYEDLRLHLQFERSEEGADWIDAATLTVSGAPGGDFTLTSEAGLSGYGQLGIYPIDRQGGMSIVFATYTGGAHCCMSLFAARVTPDGHQVADLGYHNGVSITVTDFDEDGLFEFDLLDDQFNYTFDAYAGSFSPVVVMVTDDGKAHDASKETSFRRVIKNDMAFLSTHCGGDQGWYASACAALAADAARIGRYDQVRAQIEAHLRTGDFDSGWDDFSFCIDDECENREEFSAFLPALDYALARWGYL